MVARGAGIMSPPLVPTALQSYILTNMRVLEFLETYRPLHDARTGGARGGPLAPPPNIRPIS